MLAVECCLIQKLPGFFSPEVVFLLDEETIRRIAGENEASTAERSRLTDMLAILEAGLMDLRLRTGYRMGIPDKSLVLDYEPSGEAEMNGVYATTRSETAVSVIGEIGVPVVDSVLSEPQSVPVPVPVPVDNDWKPFARVTPKTKMRKIKKTKKCESASSLPHPHWKPDNLYSIFNDVILT